MTLELGFVITAKNQASYALRSIRGDLQQLERSGRDVSRGMRDTGSSLSDLRGAFAGLGGVLAGGMIIKGVQGIASGLASLGGQALESYASYERLSMSLESLVARQLIASSGTEKYVKTGTAVLHLTDAEKNKLNELQLEYRKLSAEITVQEEHLGEATASGRDSAAELELRRIRIEENKRELAAMGAEIDKLQGKEGKMVAVTKRVIEGQLSMDEAMKLAGPQAKELLNWMQKLAIQSPFGQEDVAQGFQLALTFGYNIDQAKKLTETMIDFASATGASGDKIGQIMLVMGQMRTLGKVTTQDMNQLSVAGIPVREILADAFGVTTQQLQKMVEQGLVPADKAIQAITDSLDRDFGGAAQRQSNTWQGLLNSLGDLKTIGLREFFTGTFEAIQPRLVSFVGLLTDEKTQEGIRKLGDALGTYLDEKLQGAEAAISKFNSEYSKTGDVVGAVTKTIADLTGGKATVQGTDAVFGADNQIIVPAQAQIIGIDWTSGIDKTGVSFTYDAQSQVTKVNWTQALGTDVGYTYSAETGITEVHWNEDGFNFAYDYKANTGITNVFWGAYTHEYTATTNISSVLWGVYYHIYDSGSTVTDVAWGAWTHEYNASTKISETSVLWGAWTHQYDALTKISETNVLWGGWSNTYDAYAKVGEKSVLWGLWTNTYDAEGNLTSLTIMGKAPSEWLKSLSGSWVFPAIPKLADEWWPDVPKMASSWWPDVPKLTTSWWPDIPKLASSWWPTINTPDWLGGLLNWSPAMPDWVNTLLSWAGVAPAHNAIGTANWRGGLTWVGETGPEPVWLPQGSRIFSNNESMQMAGAGGGVTVNLYVTANTALDWEQAAYRVADIIQQRRR